MKKLLITLIWLPLFAGATNYYISPGGSNSNSGTSQGSSLQTSAGLVGKTLNPGDSVLYQAGGTYYGVMVFTNNGTAIAPIVYGSYGTGAQPIINGLLSLSGWTSIGNGVYETASPGCKITNKIFLINNKLGYIGRTPNSFYNIFTAYDATHVFDGTLTGSHVGSGIGVRSSHFSIDLGTITAQSGDTITLTPALAYTAQPVNGYFFYSNISDLDTVSEFLMRHNGDSIMAFFGSSGPGGYTCLASKIDTLAYITKSYVILNGLHLTGGNIYTLFVNGGTGVQVLNCTVDNNGVNGITFYNAIFGAINNCSVQNSNSNGILCLSGCNNITVTNNAVNNTGMKAGMGGSGGGGTYIGIFNTNMSTAGVYMYNTITNSGYTALSFNGDSSVVEFNFINGFCSIKDDGGGVYTWAGSAPGYTHHPKIKGNIIINGIGAPFGATGALNILADGVYLDSHSAQNDVLYNTILTCTSGVLVHGPSNKLDSNVIFNNPYAQIFFQEVNDGVNITSTECQGNYLGASNNTQLLLGVMTWTTDLNSYGFFNNNYYLIPAGSNTSFFTKSSTDNGTNRTLSGFTTNVGYETNSTLLNTTPSVVYNASSSPANVSVPGRYKGPDGTIYQSVVPLSGWQGILLNAQNVGFFNIQAGSPINLNH